MISTNLIKKISENSIFQLKEITFFKFDFQTNMICIGGMRRVQSIPLGSRRLRGTSAHNHLIGIVGDNEHPRGALRESGERQDENRRRRLSGMKNRSSKCSLSQNLLLLEVLIIESITWLLGYIEIADLRLKILQNLEYRLWCQRTSYEARSSKKIPMKRVVPKKMITQRTWGIA